MQTLVRMVVTAVCTLGVLCQAPAQPPPGGRGKESGRDVPKDAGKSDLVTRMMAFNKKGDGKLTKDEVTDVRLHRLFDLADANKDGVVTREELAALAAKLEADAGPEERRDGPPGRGPGDGPPGRGPGDRGPGGPPRPGQILPPGLQERLNLSDDQKKQLAELQQEVDRKLAKILTDDQKKKLQEMRERPGRGPGAGAPPPLLPSAKVR